MKVIVLGSGGREHSIVWKLSQSNKVSSIFCIPGNGGISDIAECVDINLGDFESLIQFAKREHIDLVVVGPENPLASGIVDVFEKAGIPIFGPSLQGARIESSKIFAKELMDKYNVPTAGFQVFHDFNEAKKYLESISPPYVIKADGLCAGKGAYVVQNEKTGLGILNDLMEKGIHGEAGKKIIVEQFLQGIEASYIGFTDGKTVLPMLPSQDHKPLLDGDRGPNTGGMGAYTPIPFINDEIDNKINNFIMNPVVNALKKEGINYKGALYGGLMLQGSSPYVIEFNARLGDPETQPLFFHMVSDILPVFLASVEGNLSSIEKLEWKKGVTICVVLASKGYPDNPEKGKKIYGLEDLKDNKDVFVFHSGTKKQNGDYITSGGRVLGVTASGETYKDAIRTAYDAISLIKFDGMQFRKDIGQKAIAKKMCTGSGI